MNCLPSSPVFGNESNTPSVLHVIHSRGWGGAERYVIALAQGFLGRGWRVGVAAPKNSHVHRLLPEGVAFHPVGMRGFVSLRSMVTLSCAARHYALIHGHLQRGGYYSAIAGRYSGATTVFSGHSTNAFRYFPKASKVIAVSRAVETVLRDNGYQNVERIYTGIPDIASARAGRVQARRALGLEDHDVALGMVARIAPVKGHDVLLDALSQIRHSNLRVFFAGSGDAAWEDSLRAKVRARNLPVVFLGTVVDPERILSALDVLVAPSRREAFSLSLIEAACMSLPIVGSDIGGIPELVAHGRNGLLFPVGDSNALAQCLNRLADNLTWAREMGQRNRNLFLSRFTINRMLDEIEISYQRSLRKHPQYPDVSPGWALLGDPVAPGGVLQPPSICGSNGLSEAVADTRDQHG